jgi:PAS domain S-box-containing protein
VTTHPGEKRLREQNTALQEELERRTDLFDVQEKKGLEAAEMFRLLVTSVRDYAIFLLDPTGHVATWNTGAQRLKGYAADEIVGKHFSVFYPHEDKGKCPIELEGAVKDGRFEDEGWRVRKDGTKFWANVVITALFDETGRHVGFGKVTRDLTERKAAEEARVASEERFRFLVESIRDYAIFILDPTGHVSTWNIGAERIKGYKAHEIIGSHFSKFYPEEDVRAGKCELELDVATREGVFEDEGWRVRKDGSKFWASVLISAIRDRSGKLIGFSKVTRDLTDRKRIEDERTARLAAEQANRAKDEFLAMLGHELRNPMAPIVTALQLIKLRADGEASKEHQILERQVAHMMHLIDDLLDVSRITRGKIELKRRRFDLRDSLAKAIEIASPLFEQRRHHFDLQVPARPIFVEADEARLTQVFANLLTNAAKYTNPGGRIALSVTQVGTEVAVQVVDNGIGIDAELLPRVFDLFVQGYQSSARSTGGLGLGLALVRSLIIQHGGTVEAHSPGRGKGSTFVVKLPALAEEIKAAGERSGPLSTAFPASAHKQSILIVDDNVDACMLLADILSAVGHDVKTANDGPEALELVKQFAPDTAILDIGLPVMDGYELARKLTTTLPKKPRLIAVTGYGQSADTARSEAAGFDRHLVKPVDLRKLLDTIKS